MNAGTAFVLTVALLSIVGTILGVFFVVVDIIRGLRWQRRGATCIRLKRPNFFRRLFTRPGLPPPSDLALRTYLEGSHR